MSIGMLPQVDFVFHFGCSSHKSRGIGEAFLIPDKGAGVPGGAENRQAPMARRPTKPAIEFPDDAVGQYPGRHPTSSAAGSQFPPSVLLIPPSDTPSGIIRGRNIPSEVPVDQAETATARSEEPSMSRKMLAAELTARLADRRRAVEPPFPELRGDRGGQHGSHQVAAVRTAATRSGGQLRFRLRTTRGDEGSDY